MKFKGTAILFLLFAALGGYVYFAEFRGKEDREKQEEAKKKVFQVEDKDINEVSLIYPDHTITAVRKGERQWEMTSPAGIQTDSDEWESLASKIAKVEREDTVQANAQDLAPFGLKDPVVKVTAKTKDGKTLEIAFGSENPKKTNNYAKLGGNNDVFLTASNSAKTFTKNVSDLRNKRILEFETDNVDKVQITDGSKELLVQKSGEDWLLKKPLETKADSGEISTFAGAINLGRVNSFPEPPVDAKTAGLEPPAMTVVLHDSKANKDHTLLIGKTSAADRYYARDASRDPIFIIDKEIVEKARRPLFDWRDKTITKLDRDKIDKIEIVRGADRILLSKEGSDWKLADGKKAQWDKISGMLNSLDFEKAKEIIDAPKALGTYGLDKPKIEVAMRQGSNELARILFGNDSKKPDEIFVKTSDSSSVKVVSKDVSDRFEVKAEDLVDSEKPKP